MRLLTMCPNKWLFRSIVKRYFADVMWRRIQSYNVANSHSNYNVPTMGLKSFSCCTIFSYILLRCRNTPVFVKKSLMYEKTQMRLLTGFDPILPHLRLILFFFCCQRLIPPTTHTLGLLLLRNLKTFAERPRLTCAGGK